LLRVQQISTSGVNVSWLFIATHSEVETAGAGEKVKQQVWDWSSNTTR
jgi:hypothetical protein